MKRFLTLFLTVIIISTSAPALASSRVNGIILNNKPLEMDVNPVIIEGRTLVPVRALFEALEMDVSWNQSEKIVRAEKEGVQLDLVVSENNWDSRNRYNRIQYSNEDTPPQIINNRTFIPVRFAAETLGLDVKWDDKAKNVIIQEKDVKPPLSIDQAYKVLIDKFGYSHYRDFVYMPFGGYAGRDKYIMDNYYVFAIKSIVDEGVGGDRFAEYYADFNYCVHKNTGEIRSYNPW